MRGAMLMMAALCSLSLLSLSVLPSASAASTDDWRSRAIYQIITDRFSQTVNSTEPCLDLRGYCGGTFAGIASHLSYISDLGFDAIWISPVVLNQPGEYHGYAAKDLYRISPEFGGESGLSSLVSAAHAAGLYVMVDVVGNHMGVPQPDPADFSALVPFNSFDKFYHSCSGCPPASSSGGACWIVDFANRTQTLECQLDGLPDLDQSVPWVASTLVSWVSALVSNYSLDGLRVDTVPEVAASFWSSFVGSAGVYSVGEVFDGSVPYVSSYQQPAGPLPATLSYPMYFTLSSVFGSCERPSMRALAAQLQSYASAFPDPGSLGSFLENHDHARFLFACADLQLYRAGLMWAMYAAGIPILYYGAEQLFDGGDDPYNRAPLWTTAFDQSGEQYRWTQIVMHYRREQQLWSNTAVMRIGDDDEVCAFSRGTAFVALTNSAAGQLSRPISAEQSPFAPNTQICNLFWPTEDCITTAADGSWTLVLNSGEQKVFDLKANIQRFHSTHTQGRNDSGLKASAVQFEWIKPIRSSSGKDGGEEGVAVALE